MKVFRIAFLLTLCLCAGSCTHKSHLHEAALKQLPITLEAAMAEYMGTVGKPIITDLQVIFDCDSLCILQCKASAPDASGKLREDTVRYFFVRDNMMSAFYGRPQYFDSVTGAQYLDKAGIREFVKKYNENSNEHYTYYLGMSAPVDSFQ